MLKVLSFDVDGTLVDARFADMFWNDGVPRLYAKKEGISFKKAKDYLRGRYDEIGDGDLRWYLPEYWFGEFGLGKSPEDLIKQYTREIHVFPEVRGVLERLSKKYTLVASSNAPRMFLEQSVKGLCKYFSHTFSSTSDFGMVKKAPDFYHSLFEILKIEPCELAHVGDHYEFDYLVPMHAGVKSFYLDRKGTKTGGHILRDLSELEERL